MKRTALKLDETLRTPRTIALALPSSEPAVHLTAEECEFVQDVFMRTHLRRTLKIPGRRKGDLRIPDLLGRLNADQVSRYCAWNWRKSTS